VKYLRYQADVRAKDQCAEDYKGVAQPRAFVGYFPKVESSDVSRQHTGNYQPDLDEGSDFIPVCGDETDDAGTYENGSDYIYGKQQPVCGFFGHLVETVSLRQRDGLLGRNNAVRPPDLQLLFQ
jgi:hypothetical protein